MYHRLGAVQRAMLATSIRMAAAPVTANSVLSNRRRRDNKNMPYRLSLLLLAATAFPQSSNGWRVLPLIAGNQNTPELTEK